MPHLLNVNSDTMSVPPGGVGANTLIPKGTMLNVKGVFRYSGEEERYLKCGFGLQTVSFKESMRVNFTAVNDKSQYTLAYIKKAGIFPAIIEFINPRPDDISHFPDDDASLMLIIAQGPLELKSAVQTEVFVCWKREQTMKCYSTLVIPLNVAMTLKVKKRLFEDHNFMASYLDRKYSACEGTGFVETGMYRLDPDLKGIGHLKSQILYCYDQKNQKTKALREKVRYNGRILISVMFYSEINPYPIGLLV